MKKNDLLIAFCAAVVSGLLTICVFRLYRDFPTFLLYNWMGGDTLATHSMTVPLLQGDWWPFGAMKSHRLGAPFGYDLADFPVTDHAHFLGLKILSLLSGQTDTILIYNLYWLLSFPLTAFVAALVLSRLFEGWNGLTLSLAVAFSILPYHVNRYDNLVFAAHYMIPVQAWFIYRFADLSWLPSEGTWKQKLGAALRWPFLLLYSASANVYYVFFTCYFLVVGALMRVFEPLGRKALRNALLCILILCAGVLFNIRHSLYTWAEEGRNPVVAVRNPIHAEVYGFKLAPFLFPTSFHLVPALAKPRLTYDSGHRTTGGFHESAGLVTSLSLLLVLFALLLKGSSLSPLARNSALFILLGLLLATVGGFGTIFNFLVSPQIRAYERISPFLAFFALVGAGALIKEWWQKKNRSWARPLALAANLILVGCVFADYGNYAGFRPVASDGIDREFYTQVGKEMKARTNKSAPMLLQLPYVEFPEGPFVHKMYSYNHFKGAMYAPDLLWSHGVIQGREGDRILKALSDLFTTNFEKALEEAMGHGYDGVVLDCDGYEDQCQKIKTELSQRVGEAVAISQDQRYWLFTFPPRQN